MRARRGVGVESAAVSYAARNSSSGSFSEVIESDSGRKKSSTVSLRRSVDSILLRFSMKASV